MIMQAERTKKSNIIPRNRIFIKKGGLVIAPSLPFSKYLINLSARCQCRLVRYAVMNVIKSVNHFLSDLKRLNYGLQIYNFLATTRILGIKYICRYSVFLRYMILCSCK